MKDNNASLYGVAQAIKSIVEFFRFWKLNGDLKEAKVQKEREGVRLKKAEATSKEIDNAKKFLAFAKEYCGSDCGENADLEKTAKAIEVIRRNLDNGNILDLHYRGRKPNK